MPTKRHEVPLASRPQGEAALDNFAFATVEVPHPKPDEVLVRHLCMSVDPYMRREMNEGKSYVPPLEIASRWKGEP